MSITEFFEPLNQVSLGNILVPESKADAQVYKAIASPYVLSVNDFLFGLYPFLSLTLTE